MGHKRDLDAFGGNTREARLTGSASIVVGVPMYNESSYARETIAALRAQEGRQFTAYISDNCSSDGTFDIVRQEVGDDPRFRLIRHPRNMGALFNFEYLLAAADSDYFMWLGGHDRLSANAVGRLAEILDTNPDASMAMAYPHAIAKDGTDEGPLTKAVYDFRGSAFERYVQSVWKLENCTILHAMFRREKAKGFRFEPVLGSDHPFISMLLWHGRLIYDQQSIYYRRMFPLERSAEAAQMERVTGTTSERHSWEGLVGAYMRSFDDLYGKDRSGFSQARRQVFDTLVTRFEFDVAYDDRAEVGVEKLSPKSVFPAGAFFRRMFGVGRR